MQNLFVKDKLVHIEEISLSPMVLELILFWDLIALFKTKR